MSYEVNLKPNTCKRVWNKTDLKSPMLMRDMIHEYNVDGFIFVKYLCDDDCDRSIKHIIDNLYLSQIWGKEVMNRLVPRELHDHTSYSKKKALYKLMKGTSLSVVDRRSIDSISPLSLRSRSPVSFLTESPAYHLSDAWKLRQAPDLYKFAHTLLNFQLTDEISDNHKKNDRNIFCGIDPCQINYGWKGSKDVNDFLYFSLNPFHNFNYEKDKGGETSFNQVLMRSYYSPNSIFTCVPGSHTRSYFENEFYGKFPSFFYQQSLYDSYNKTGMYICRPKFMGKTLYHDVMRQKQVFQVERGVIVIYSPYLLVTKNMCNHVSKLSPISQIYYGQNLSYFTDNKSKSTDSNPSNKQSCHSSNKQSCESELIGNLGRHNYESLSKTHVNEFKDRLNVYENGTTPALTSCLWPIDHAKLFLTPTIQYYFELIKMSVFIYNNRIQNQSSYKISDFVKMGEDGKYIILDKYPFWQYKKPKLTKLGKQLLGITPWSSVISPFNDFSIDEIMEFSKIQNDEMYQPLHSLSSNDEMPFDHYENTLDHIDHHQQLNKIDSQQDQVTNNGYQDQVINSDYQDQVINNGYQDQVTNNGYQDQVDKCNIYYYFPEFTSSHTNDNKKRKREKEEDEVDSVDIEYNQMFFGSHDMNDSTLFSENDFIDFSHHNNLFSSSTLINEIANDDNTSDKYQINSYYINMINSMLDKPEKSIYCYEQLDLPQNNNTLISSLN